MAEICHKDQISNFEPPIINFVAYVTGGLRKLCSQIQSQEANVFPLYEYGQFTNHSGQFIAKRDCLLASRYRVVEVVGTGSRGQSAVIVRAKDEFDGNKLVVIKVLHTNWRWLGAQEAHCLWKLQVADPYRASSTSRLLNVFMHDDHYCMVFEALCPEPLTAIFTEIPRDQILPCLRKVTLRLLSTLGFLKQQNVIHADLKPENILLKKEGNLSSVTVIDFGNAMHHIFPEVSLYYKDFVVQTPLYRAPEVMFGIPFGTEIDMWSLGCILVELYKGTQLFHGTSKIPLIKEMTRLLGPFPLKVYQRGKFYSSLKQYTADIVQKDASAVLEKKLGCHDYLFRDFLAGLLRYDPDERMTPYQAAQHPFLCSDLPLAFLLPNSKDLKLFNEYSFKPVKNYTGTNTYVENIGESSAFKVEVKVLKDDDLYNEEDKKAYRKGEKLEDNRNKGVKEKECLRNQMDKDDVKEAHFEHQSLDIKKPLLSETYTIEEDVSETRKTVGYQKDNSVSNYENRTACSVSSQIHGRNDDRLSSTINKSCVDNKMKECKKRSDNRREKIQREHNLDKGLKRKFLDCDDISDNSSRSKMEGRALGRNRSKIETRKYEDQNDSDEFYEENSFPDLSKRSKQKIHETNTRTSHHDNAKFQLGSKPDLQSIMKAISREQEIVERDLKRKSDETFLYGNERKKKDNSHYVQNIPKGIVDRDFMCSGTTECTESEVSEDDEFGTESDAESMCVSGITVSKKGYRMDKQDGRIQKTKSSNGTDIQSTCTMNEQNDEVDSMQNLVFPKKRKSEGELSDQNCRKSRQNKNEIRKSQSSDYKNDLEKNYVDTTQIPGFCQKRRLSGDSSDKNFRWRFQNHDVTVKCEPSDDKIREKSKSQTVPGRCKYSNYATRKKSVPSTVQCISEEGCGIVHGKGGADSHAEGREQVKYSTKTVREKKVISTTGEDVPKSQTTMRYSKKVKKRLMFTGALKCKSSQSVRTKKKCSNIVESKPCAKNRDGVIHKRGKNRRHSGKGSEAGDPYRFTEDSPLKRHQRNSHVVCKNDGVENNENTSHFTAKCSRSCKKSTLPSSSLSKPVTEDVLLSYNQTYPSNECGSREPVTRIDLDRGTDRDCSRNVLSLDHRISERRKGNLSDTTSTCRLGRASEEQRNCSKDHYRTYDFGMVHDSLMTGIERRRKVCSGEKSLVRSPLSADTLEGNGGVSQDLHQASYCVKNKKSSGDMETSEFDRNWSYADRRSGMEQLRNKRGNRTHTKTSAPCRNNEDIEEDCDVSLIASPPSYCGDQVYRTYYSKSRKTVKDKMSSDSDEELMLIE